MESVIGLKWWNTTTRLTSLVVDYVKKYALDNEYLSIDSVLHDIPELSSDVSRNARQLLEVVTINDPALQNYDIFQIFLQKDSDKLSLVGDVAKSNIRLRTDYEKAGLCLEYAMMQKGRDLLRRLSLEGFHSNFMNDGKFVDCQMTKEEAFETPGIEKFLKNETQDELRKALKNSIFCHVHNGKLMFTSILQRLQLFINRLCVEGNPPRWSRLAQLRKQILEDSITCESLLDAVQPSLLDLCAPNSEPISFCTAAYLATVLSENSRDHVLTCNEKTGRICRRGDIPMQFERTPRSQDSWPQGKKKKWDKRWSEKWSCEKWSWDEKKSHDFVPSRGDVKKVRELFQFYLTPFQLQHNRLLRSLLEAGCTKDSPEAWTRPSLSFEQLKKMPRVGRTLTRYKPPYDRVLIRAALEQVDPARCLELELSDQSGSAVLKLSWMPRPRRMIWTSEFQDDFARFREFNVFDEEEKKFYFRTLLWPSSEKETQSTSATKSLESDYLKILSYQISSDLSNELWESRRVQNVKLKLMENMQPHFFWPMRRGMFRREFAFYDADVMCLQSVQSLSVDGFAYDKEANRPEFTEPQVCKNRSWLHSLENESEDGYGGYLDHAMCFAATLADLDYAYAYSPVTITPLHPKSRDEWEKNPKKTNDEVYGNEEVNQVSFGSMVFWKQSVFKLVDIFPVEDHALVVVLRRRVDPQLDLVIVCFKCSAGYLREWESPPPHQRYENARQEAILNSCKRISSELRARFPPDTKIVWCGDFGGPPSSSVYTHVTEQKYTSAMRSCRGSEPNFTSVHPKGYEETTDYIFCNERIRVCGVFDIPESMVDAVYSWGSQNRASLVRQWPSDRLALFAVLAWE